MLTFFRAASAPRWARGQSDETIARAAKMWPIAKVANSLGLSSEQLVPYGHYKAKVPLEELKGNKQGKLILVTAITPTKAGEGKTTCSIGLSDGLCRLGKKALVALREPSLGPVFGMKGGAAGGGYSQVVPMDEINLHFTGDFHAIGAAHNLLSAMVDNHIYWGKEPMLDQRRVSWRRVVDMNDRALRSINVGLGGPSNGFMRPDGFDITVASEVMAIFCLANDMEDLQRRLGNIAVGETRGAEKVRKMVYAKDLKAEGAMTALLKDALSPNLVQTLENNPALIHGGPFANIAHGCNSVIATKAGLKMADYVITEAGFGADLGAEKFFNIKCRKAGLAPDAAVLVATARALKLHGGADAKQLHVEDVEAVKDGMGNLKRHLENLQKFGVPVVVCVNRFPTDTQAELETLVGAVEALGCRCIVSDHHARGGEGAEALAQAVLDALEQPASFAPLYPDDMPIDEKIRTIATSLYHANEIHFADEAKAQIAKLQRHDVWSRYPVCMAKTQYSFSEDPAKINAPSGHSMTVREVRLCQGAEFVVALTGSIMTMPGLPKVPSSEAISVVDGQIRGLF